MQFQAQSTSMLSSVDTAKLKRVTLNKPVCATHGRYNWGPRKLLIAGTGIEGSHVWKYSFVKNKMIQLKMELGFGDVSKVAIGNDYVVKWSKDRNNYSLFNVKNMAWSTKYGKAKIGKDSKIIPIHVSQDICHIKGH